jgi:hypothetical protein
MAAFTVVSAVAGAWAWPALVLLSLAGYAALVTYLGARRRT